MTRSARPRPFPISTGILPTLSLAAMMCPSSLRISMEAEPSIMASCANFNALCERIAFLIYHCRHQLGGVDFSACHGVEMSAADISE